MIFAGKPLVLAILDGWGMKQGTRGDALSLAKIENFDKIWAAYPHCVLDASGAAVGLPPGQMGDSEVGHMSIGSGRVVYQDSARITNAIKEGTLKSNEAIVAACDNVKTHGSALHLFGLLSDGGIHSQIAHLFGLLDVLKEKQVTRVFVHCFMDGRDTAVNSGIDFIAQLEEKMQAIDLGKIATVTGRFFAMDRDKRWDRTKKAYDVMVYGEGEHYPSAAEAIQASYDQKITDEFIEPKVIVDDQDRPVGLVQSHDSILFYNYRSDRAREISHAFMDEEFIFFDRGPTPPKVFYVCMAKYDDALKNVRVAFPPSPPVNTLGKVLSRNGLRQLRIAETEKYAHVTFFFNGGVERMDNGEDRVMIPSPNVSRYDMQPEMSCPAVTRAVLDRITSGIYDVIILNFANPDMLGHTGNLHATIQSVHAVDESLGQIASAIHQAGGTLIVTADHGNVECMMDAEGHPITSHTTNLVPFILVDDELAHVKLREKGALRDIAPTMLQLLGLKQPAEMTGVSLIESGIDDFNQTLLVF